LEKPKEIQTGMIGGFAHLGQNLSLHPHHCIAPGGGVDKMAIEEYKRRWQILTSSQGVVQGFRANIVRGFTRKAQIIIILESRNNCWRNSGRFAKSLSEVL
jgi:hypothetical protein